MVVRCPDCWKGKPLPCAVGCRDWDGCCDKRLDGPCEPLRWDGGIKMTPRTAEKRTKFLACGCLVCFENRS